MIKKASNFLFLLALIFSVTAFSAVIYCDAKYPAQIYSSSKSQIKINDFCSVFTNSKNQAKSVSSLGSATYPSVMKVLGIVPVKDVNVSVVPADSVVVCGTPFGVMLYSQGVMVVGSAPFKSAQGNVDPALDAGIKVGDMILSIDGVQVNSIEDVTECVKRSGGKKMNFLCSRDGKNFTAAVTAQKGADDDNYHIGLWVRDSSAGIGTMTFYHPDLSVAVGFGHPICDADTGKPIELSQGTAVNATIYSLRKGAAGNPGELLGALKIRSPLGEVLQNSNNGVYFECNYQPDGVVMPVSYWSEATTGKAQIYTTVNGQTPCYYDVRIDGINPNSDSKNFEITVTDPKLIEQTGGILQGMSGSPLIQNGKLIGAVTHVLVDDSCKGYGIFAETMLDTAQSVSVRQLKEAS